jgi:hypothetical protein
LVKKIALISIAIILVILCLTLGLGIFIYLKGPDYALKKAQSLAKNNFQTEIKYKQTGFIGNDGFFIDDLEIKKSNIEFSIHRLQFLAQIKWNERALEIHEILLNTAKIKAELVTYEDTQDLIEKDYKKNYQSILAFQDFVSNPPNFIKIHKLKIADLSAEVAIQKNNLSGTILQNQKISIKKINIQTDFDLKSDSLNAIIKIQSHSPIELSQTAGQKNIHFDLADLNIQLNGSMKKTASGDWDYHLKPITINGKFNALDIQRDFHLKVGPTQWQIGSGIQIQSAKTSNLVSQISTATHPFPFQIKDLSWDIKIKTEKLKGNGLEAFQFIPELGSGFDFESHGNLKPALATLARFDLPWTWETGLSLKAGPFKVKKESTNLRLKAQWVDTKGNFSIETFPKKLVMLAGRSEVQKKQLQFDGTIEANFPRHFLSQFIDQNIYGILKVPLHFSVVSGVDPTQKEISLETILQLKNLNFENKTMSALGINGQIPISEKIYYNPNKQGKPIWTFKELVNPNPFERADYQRLDPLVRTNETLNIKSLKFASHQVGPFKGVLEISQNLFSLHQFSLDLDSGSASGEFYMDLNPKNQRLGFLGRLSNLNLKELLPNKYLKISRSENLPFSARAGVAFSMNRRSLNGRMDITQFGSPQCLAFINILDPAYENNKLNKARSLLEVGHPTALGMAFQEGFLDLTIDIESMGLKTQLNMPGLSIQSFIDQSFADKNLDDPAVNLKK